MDERPAPETPAGRLPWEGLIGGLAGCLAVAILSMGLAGYYLLPKLRKATANFNLSANVTVTPAPETRTPAPVATASDPEPSPPEPEVQPRPSPSYSRPDWNATDPTPSESFVVSQVKRSDGAVLYAENRKAYPITVTIRFSQNTNVITQPRFPYTTTVAGKEKLKLATLSTARRGAWSYKYLYHYCEGSTTARHDPRHVYSLPFDSGESYPVTVVEGSEYHFAMDEDSPVLAARAGVVVEAEKRYSGQGMSDEFFRRVNRVLIRHSDGTLGAYYHLRPGGVSVAVGDRVETGDLLGFSGQTGHTTSPQLAFCVFKARDGNSRQRFPLRFATSSSPQGTFLATGMDCEAPE